MATKTPDISETYLSRDKADQWGRGKQRRDAAFGPATEMMLELVGLRAGDHVLDVAAGTGDSSLMAARRVGPGGHVLAVDISANMLKGMDESAQEAGLTNFEARVMNAEKLELETDSFERRHLSDCLDVISGCIEGAHRDVPRGETWREGGGNGVLSGREESIPQLSVSHRSPSGKDTTSITRQAWDVRAWRAGSS